MALDIVKPKCFKITGKFVAMDFFFFPHVTHEKYPAVLLNFSCIPFLPLAGTAHYISIISYFPQPTKVIVVFQGRRCLLEKNTATATYFTDYLNLLGKYIFRIFS